VVCPVCKNSHPDWFTTVKLHGIVHPTYTTQLGFFCKKCGVVFVALTEHDMWYWRKMREQEKKEGKA
jgi:hypothetical protein